MFTSPVLGFMVAILWISLLYLALARCRPNWVNYAFRNLQIVSSALMGFSHGSNDAQKTMGILALALFTATKSGDLANAPWFLEILKTPEVQHSALGQACLRRKQWRPAPHPAVGALSRPLAER